MVRLKPAFSAKEPNPSLVWVNDEVSKFSVEGKGKGKEKEKEPVPLVVADDVTTDAPPQPSKIQRRVKTKDAVPPVVADASQTAQSSSKKRGRKKPKHK
jgi:hypothetical protein